MQAIGFFFVRHLLYAIQIPFFFFNDIYYVTYKKSHFYMAHTMCHIKLYGFGINTQMFPLIFSLFPIESLSDIDKSRIAITD